LEAGQTSNELPDVQTIESSAKAADNSRLEVIWARLELKRHTRDWRNRLIFGKAAFERKVKTMHLGTKRNRYLDENRW